MVEGFKKLKEQNWFAISKLFCKSDGAADSQKRER